jgi:hypothetical protein
MAFEKNRAGVTKGERANLDRMAGWDEMEQTVAVGSLSGNLDLTGGVLGDNSGVGSGAKRENYYCYGIHNGTDTAVTVVMETVKAGAGKSFSLYIPAGGWAMPLLRVKTIVKSGTTNKALVLLYKDKYAMDQTGELQGITE